MKYIQKSSLPAKFTNWKNQENENWQPSWNNLQNPEKAEVHYGLLKELGFICCYCQIRISKDNSHIEHLKPRNIYPNLALDYNNLLASCQGENEQSPPIPVHCGHKKGDWYEENIMISPLGIDCADCFRYTDDGQVLATNHADKQDAAQETIERLGLNINKLKKLREKAIEAIIDDIDSLKPEQIRKLINGFEQHNNNGEYIEFYSSIIYVLKQYLLIENSKVIFIFCDRLNLN